MTCAQPGRSVIEVGPVEPASPPVQVQVQGEDGRGGVRGRCSGLIQSLQLEPAGGGEAPTGSESDAN